MRDSLAIYLRSKGERAGSSILPAGQICELVDSEMYDGKLAEVRCEGALYLVPSSALEPARPSRCARCAPDRERKAG